MKQIYNPFLPLCEYIPDGEPHVFGDRVYVYGSHDKESGDFFCMLDYVCYSASIYDLKDWRYEGVIYKAKNDPDYVNHPYMYAPDVVQGNDGKYYLYYSLAGRDECSFLMSVAVCDTPAGEYKFLGYVKNPDGTPLQDFIIFDPGLINDGGHIYLYYGVWYDFDENPSFTREESIKKQMSMYKKTREEIESTEGGVQGPVCVELMDDMMTIKHKPVHIFPTRFKGTSFEGHEFFEASSIRKIGEKYYFIYSTFNQHELAYATSDRPDGGFEYGGVIISNGDVGYMGRRPEDRVNRTGNNHGSIEKINGEWYIFYHRQTHKNDYSRQACAEKIQLLDNGTIPQVEMTSCGLNGGPLLTEGTYPATICCNLTNGKMPHTTGCLDGIPVIVYKDNERIITDVSDGTKIGYKYFDFKGETSLGITYKNGKNQPLGKVFVKTSLDGAPICSFDVAPSENWTRAGCTVNLNGKNGLFFEYKGQGQIEILDIYFGK
ncbi:MAG: family 43 glycosylhydrolase [Clostridia bacterium]|nr:family 43 glycosylhydrolase [Clostridia bacterium]